MSDLFRHAQGRENRSINLLSNALSDGPEGTVRNLMDVHFPGHSVLVEEGRENAYYGVFSDALREINYLTVDKIHEALASISSYKAAGPDGFKPIVPKNVPDSCINRPPPHMRDMCQHAGEGQRWCPFRNQERMTTQRQSHSVPSP